MVEEAMLWIRGTRNKCKFSAHSAPLKEGEMLTSAPLKEGAMLWTRGNSNRCIFGSHLCATEGGRNVLY